MAVKGAEGRRRSYASPEQTLYARILAAGMKLGLLVLMLGFVAYVSGAVSPHVPLTELPRLWILPAADYLGATGVPGGWGWVTMLHKGDILPFVGVAVLAAVSLVCFVVVVPSFARRRDWPYFAIAVLEICVLSLAASGILTVH
jgi:hypothetical protein